MISLKVLSTVAAMALVLPMMTPSASFAAPPEKGGGMARGAGGGGNMRGAGGGQRMSGAAQSAQFGGGMSGQRFGNRSGGNGNGVVSNQRFSSGGNGNVGASNQRFGDRDGGNWNRGGDRRRGGRGGFFPGAVAGAVIGGAIASNSYGYYDGGPGYYSQGYDDQYYDDGGGTFAVAPDQGGDSVGYCSQTYRSYDPASGTYLGYDGLRHPCP